VAVAAGGSGEATGGQDAAAAARPPIERREG
jgi:hypothetical protein